MFVFFDLLTFQAPEILRFKQYDAKVDLWAVGAVLFEIVTGQPPFPAATPNVSFWNMDSDES